MLVQVIGVVAAVVVVLHIGVGDILEADLDHTLVPVILANMIETFIVHTHVVQCHLDDVMLETETIHVLPDV